MKLLENNGFEVLNSSLFLQSGDARIVGRLESYSCKMIGSEKTQYKKFLGSGWGAPHSLEALSPPSAGFGGYASGSYPASYTLSSYPSSYTHSSSYNRAHSLGSGSEDEGYVSVLCDTIQRKTRFYLISTLNAAFPDYDFSCTKAEEFTKEPSLQFVTNNVDSLLSLSGNSQYAKIRDKLWLTLNDEIQLTECEIFSYNPDLSCDPFSEDGSLWGFNYFFFNKKLKRIVLFTCRALSPFSHSLLESGHSEFMDMELMDEY